MQKVVGSSLITRSSKAPLDGAFCCLRRRLCPIKSLPGFASRVGLETIAAQSIASSCPSAKAARGEIRG
jgi:hypothetical protein